MLGQMQEWPLLIHKVADFAATQHGDREIVSRLVEGVIHRETYRDLRARSLKVATARTLLIPMRSASPTSSWQAGFW